MGLTQWSRRGVGRGFAHGALPTLLSSGVLVVLLDEIAAQERRSYLFSSLSAMSHNLAFT